MMIMRIISESECWEGHNDPWIAGLSREQQDMEAEQMRRLVPIMVVPRLLSCGKREIYT